MSTRFMIAALAAVCSLLLAGTPGQSAANDLPKTPVQDSAPFNDPHVSELGAPSNCGVHLDCNNATETQVVTQANTCAHNLYGLPEGLITEYRNSGDYQGCAVPTSFQPQVPHGMRGKAQWPVCCVIPNSAGSCDMECHFMFIPESSPGAVPTAP